MGRPLLPPSGDAKTDAIRDRERKRHARRKAGDTSRTYRRSAATADQEYDDDEFEFLRAVDAFKRRHGTQFPTCTELMRILKSLGYAKRGKGEAEAEAGDS